MNHGYVRTVNRLCTSVVTHERVSARAIYGADVEVGRGQVAVRGSGRGQVGRAGLRRAGQEPDQVAPSRGQVAPKPNRRASACEPVT